jgi:hypothetical protein
MYLQHMYYYQLVHSTEIQRNKIYKTADRFWCNFSPEDGVILHKTRRQCYKVCYSVLQYCVRAGDNTRVVIRPCMFKDSVLTSQ